MIRTRSLDSSYRCPLIYICCCVCPAWLAWVTTARLVGDARIGTEDVDGSEVILCFLEAGRDRVFVRDVALDVEDVVAWRCVVKGQQIVSCNFAAGRC